MIATYRCTACGELTVVRHWHATDVDPPDSTWGDGCEHCGGDLEDEPIDAGAPEDFAPDAYDLDR